MDDIRIGITGTGSRIGQAIIKSIRTSSLAKSISMIGFDYFDNTVGSYWVKKNFILPDIFKKSIEPKTWFDKVLEAIIQEKIKLLFIGINFELPIFAKYKNLIESESRCKVVVSDESVIKIANDKYLTYEFLKRNNFYHPKTWLAGRDIDKDIEFPCIVKPRNGNTSQDVYIVSKREDISSVLSKVKDPIIQGLIGRPEAEYTCGLICFGGEVEKSIALLRTLKHGNTEVAYFNRRTPTLIYEYIHEVAHALGPYGPCNIQLRIDDRDGLPKIFEINARHSGTTYIRSLFGFKEVEYIIRRIVGLECKGFELREGIVKKYDEEIYIPLP